MTDVFAVQDEIASAITKRLRGTMHDEAERTRVRGGTRNLEAYELVLRGRALQIKRGRFVAQAVTCFEQAIALDSQYADALASLADSYRLMGVFGAAPFSEVMPKAKALAERALAIDDRMAEAWSTLGAIEEQYELNNEKSDAYYARALEIDPRHARARAQRALWRVVRGAMPTDEAVAEMHRAVQDDPFNAWVQGMHSFLCGIAGLHDESIAVAERAVSLDAESFFAQWNLLRAHAWAGHHDRAVQGAPALLNASARNSWTLGLLGWTYGQMGRADRARACYDELESRSRHEFVPPSWLAILAGSAGLMDDAMQWAARAVTEHDPIVLWGRSLPLWSTLRTDSRLAAIMRPVWTGTRG